MIDNFNIFSVESFFKRVNNVFIPSIEEMVQINKELDIINKRINDIVFNAEEFLTSIGIICRILNHYSDFTPVYDTNNKLIDSKKCYTTTPCELIEESTFLLNNLKEDPSSNLEEILETEAYIKNLKSQNIFNLLLTLENNLNISNFKLETDCEIITNFKSSLNKFNNSSLKYKTENLTEFCINNFENSNALDYFIINCSLRYSYDMVVNDLLTEAYWITDWFSKEDLNKIRNKDSALYFKVNCIINNVKEFNTSKKSLEDCQCLLDTIVKYSNYDN